MSPKFFAVVLGGSLGLCAVLFAVGIGYAIANKRARQTEFMEACAPHRQHYECLFLWATMNRSNDAGPVIVPMPIPMGR